ncbi:MAG: phosphoribosylformylglycinamidine synthase I [Candidatus Omnitrophica bacterium]|nr:phosphoribosylformylglycinamidine synthase I [Candidatus Omnitrophota bacterium]MCM8799969.1 phosphoribosylformylglycinamidine synthase I [Candidatus Omnitrophota bacterium]
MRKVRVCVLRTAGTNCDKETAFAFSKVGATVELVHINRLIEKKKDIFNYDILAIPGGFTYGDDVSAGKILANELRFRLIDKIKKFIQKQRLIIGICNGFQVLIKAGVLPGNRNFIQEASLVTNDSAKFEDRWVHLLLTDKRCIWTKGLPKIIYLPVAHAEGKFVVKDRSILLRLKKNSQIVFQYCNEKGELLGYPYNPNGSVENIAGICDETGRIFGLMPHPERHIDFLQHPNWQKNGIGLQIFRNGVEYVRKNF